MSDTSLKDEVIRNYAVKVGVNYAEAKARLDENYKKEVEEVDAKEIALKCIKAMRQMSPQLAGVVQREKDWAFKIQTLENVVRDLRTQLEAQEEIFRQMISMLNKQKPKESRFSWIWNKLKTFLLRS